MSAPRSNAQLTARASLSAGSRYRCRSCSPCSSPCWYANSENEPRLSLRRESVTCHRSGSRSDAFPGRHTSCNAPTTPPCAPAETTATPTPPRQPSTTYVKTRNATLRTGQSSSQTIRSDVTRPRTGSTKFNLCPGVPDAATNSFAYWLSDSNDGFTNVRPLPFDNGNTNG